MAGTDSSREVRRGAVTGPDESLDASSEGGGIVRTNFAPGDDVAWDVAIQDDGRIVAVGGAGFGQVGFLVARYRRDGTLDASFGDDGRVVTRYQGANARAVAIQPNDRIVVAGYNSRGLALARYRADGRLDRSFSGNGTVGPVVWGIFALAVALQPDGRIVVGGDYDIFAFGLARFRADGRLDRSFGGDGVVREEVDGVEQGASGIVIQPDGRIVATGSSGPHEYGDDTVPRFVLIGGSPMDAATARSGSEAKSRPSSRGAQRHTDPRSISRAASSWWAVQGKARSAASPLPDTSCDKLLGTTLLRSAPMKRAWQIPDDVRTVHLGGFTPAHGVEIAGRLDDAEIAYWAKAPTGFFTRLWERDVHLFVDRTKLDESREVARRVIDPEGALGAAPDERG